MHIFKQKWLTENIHYASVFLYIRERLGDGSRENASYQKLLKASTEVMKDRENLATGLNTEYL